MTRLFAACFLASLLGAAQAKEAKEKKAAGCDSEVADLKAQVAALRKELEAAKNVECAKESITIMTMVESTRGFAGEVVQTLLDKTDVDEKVGAHLSKHFTTARTLAGDAYTRAKTIDFSDLEKSKVYTAHVAPLVEKVTSHEQYKALVAPQIAKVQPHLTKATAQAKEAFGTIKSKTAPHLETLSKSNVHVDKALDKIFDGVAKVAPGHATAFPKARTERIVTLLVALFLVYNVLFATKVLLKITLAVLFKTGYFAIALPVKIVLSVLSWILFFMTGFYCCGLCRRRKNKDAAKKGDSGKKNADAKSKPKADKPKDATVDEIKKLLEQSKGKNKIEEAATLLVKKAQKGEPLQGKNFPDIVQNKIVKTDVLKKALGNFKEVDIKKIGL